MSRPLLLSCEAISMAYGTRSLFDDLSFGLFEGDQAGLVGPNGSVKSTLLKILAGVTTPDRGSRSLRGGVRVGYVPQDPIFEAGRTADEIVLEALAGVDEADRPGRAAQVLGRAEFTDGRATVDTLSGGWRKRLAIARELAAAPDILLMDEPTNHLDVAGILWLEDVLTERARAFVVVSHDRYFLEHVVTRMLELNRVYRPGCSSPREATAGSWRAAMRRCANRPPTRSPSPTPCDVRLNGCAAARRRAPPRLRAASRGRAVSSRSWKTAGPAVSPLPPASTSPRRTDGRDDSWWPAVSRSCSAAGR